MPHLVHANVNVGFSSSVAAATAVAGGDGDGVVEEDAIVLGGVEMEDEEVSERVTGIDDFGARDRSKPSHVFFYLLRCHHF
jgi:hypothetical protein